MGISQALIIGACNASGSVFDWVMKTQGLSFRFACELLQ